MLAQVLRLSALFAGLAPVVLSGVAASVSACVIARSAWLGRGVCWRGVRLRGGGRMNSLTERKEA